MKVLHGSDWDILWLQRDFGLYVVNMFDTGQAARALRTYFISAIFKLFRVFKFFIKIFASTIL